MHMVTVYVITFVGLNFGRLQSSTRFRDFAFLFSQLVQLARPSLKGAEGQKEGKGRSSPSSDQFTVECMTIHQ